jgi:hypothetical protein
VVVAVRRDEGLAELAEGGEDWGEGFVFLLLRGFCLLLLCLLVLF